MSAPVVIDSEAIKHLRDLNPGDQDEFLREIIGIFFADMPRRFTELDQSLQSGDKAKFSRAAHSIKGSSSNLGAVALKDAAGELETKSLKDGLGDVTKLLERLKAEYERARLELSKIVVR